MSLDQYFAPLSLYYGLLLFLIWIFLDQVGYAVFKTFKLPAFLRLFCWSLGLALWVCLWFVLHFWRPFLSGEIWVSLLALTLGSLLLLRGELAVRSLFQQVRVFPWPLLFLLLVPLNLFLWISSPPYMWDEMAYHYYSPAQLALEQVWPFADRGFYEMFPRFLDTAYVLVFAATKTHIAARLVHLTLLLTSLTSAAHFLKKELSYGAAVGFVFFSLFLNSSVVQGATTGYIDVAAGGLLLLFCICVIGFIKNLTLPYAVAVVITLSMALSVKYTSLSFVAATVVVMSGCLGFSKRTEIKILLTTVLKSPGRLVRSLLFLMVVGVVFGGYWYLKNTWYTGNPFFPFILPCHEWAACNSAKVFFSTWTIPLSWQTLPTVRNIYFHDSLLFFFTVIAGLVLSAYLAWSTQKSILKLFLVLSLGSLVLEMALIALFSGFDARFFYHWMFLLPLFIVLPWQTAPFEGQKQNLWRLSLGTLIVLVGVTAGQVAMMTIIDINKPERVSNHTRSYVRGRINFDQWLNYQFPQLASVITDCGQLQPLKPLAITDPQIIWRSPEGLMRVYLVNCQWSILPMPYEASYPAVVQDLVTRKAELISLTPCQPNVKNPFEENTSEFRRYVFNQQLVCSSSPIANNRYTFTGTVLSY